ncbi:MAG TPA: O-antigen ligase family protein [Solirubrobacterales bacterium]|nr:O-antigen ligase family protein [Solirubrobacterales bacterium]
MNFSTAPFRRSGIGLAAAGFLAPFSATRLIGSLTLGRAVAAAFAILLALDLFRSRPRPLVLARPGLLAGAAYAGLIAWVFVNTAIWGCNCEGKLGGLAEFALVGLLALAAISCEPRLRRLAIGATFSGLTLAAVLALLGVGSINSGTVDLTQTGGRLSGTFGNANELGFAVAVAIPIAAAYAVAARGRARLLTGASLLVLAVALVLTFSRGAVIAAACGLVAFGLWRWRGSRRHVAMILAGAAAVALIGAGLYSVFQREREDVSFEKVPATLRPLDQRDLSGWDSRAIGPIPAGPSRLRNRPGGFMVSTGRGGEGASYGWGEAAAGGSYELRFRASAGRAKAVSISFALGDAVRGGGPASQALLGPRPRWFALRWHPRRRAPHARLYVWQHSRAGASFVLSDVSVRARAPGRPAHLVDVPDELRGSIYSHMVAAVENAEARYVRSRLDASKLALEAFGSSPLWGIGWGTFPEYSNEHLDYGQLAAHDEYLSIAAELGLVGLLLVGLLAVAVVGGVRRAGRTTADTAAVGAIAAAAAGLVFVEALPVPQLSVPVAMVVAVLSARRTAPGI